MRLLTFFESEQATGEPGCGGLSARGESGMLRAGVHEGCKRGESGGGGGAVMRSKKAWWMILSLWATRLSEASSASLRRMGRAHVIGRAVGGEGRKWAARMGRLLGRLLGRWAVKWEK